MEPLLIIFFPRLHEKAEFVSIKSFALQCLLSFFLFQLLEFCCSYTLLQWNVIFTFLESFLRCKILTWLILAVVHSAVLCGTLAWLSWSSTYSSASPLLPCDASSVVLEHCVTSRRFNLSWAPAIVQSHVFNKRLTGKASPHSVTLTLAIY